MLQVQLSLRQKKQVMLLPPAPLRSLPQRLSGKGIELNLCFKQLFCAFYLKKPILPIVFCFVICSGVSAAISELSLSYEDKGDVGSSKDLLEPGGFWCRLE